MDLEGIEKECVDVGMGYVPQKHVILLKESILRSWASNQLGISLGSHKEMKRNFKEPTEKSGRKSNKQRVVEVGRHFVELGQYQTIKSLLGL